MFFHDMSCASLFDFASCCGVCFVHIERPTPINYRINDWTSMF